ncbi:helix-turn-helix domain-containing protein [Lachnospiraceae bacterium ZAX-1]
MIENYPDVLNVQDICEILRIEKKTVYGLLQEGIIPSRRIGRLYRVSKQAIVDYLAVAKKTS